MSSLVAATRKATFSVDDAWSSVALEERLDLLARVQADGILAGFIALLIVGSIAYGFDEILLLALGSVSLFFIVPMVMSYSWRRDKPAVILAYLAVRAVARRYAFAYRVVDLDTVLIFRANMQEVFASKEEEETFLLRQEADFDTAFNLEKPVWLCLLRGAVVVLSERLGGAKLEFLAPISQEVSIRKLTAEESKEEGAVLITGAGISSGRQIAISSKSKGAMYVFERQLSRLIAEYKPPANFHFKGLDNHR